MNICLKLDVNVPGDSGYASPPRLVEYEEAETLCVKPINDLGKRLKTVQLGSSSSTSQKHRNFVGPWVRSPLPTWQVLVSDTKNGSS